MKLIPNARMLIAAIGMLFLPHCASQTKVPDLANIRLDEKNLHSFDGDQFPYRTWMPKEEPEIVVIGVHGISGAAADFNPLGEYLLENLPKTAIYAAETRGQGNDPIKERRGHIRDREEWFHDLISLTHVVRKKHPGARIVWCGESMGSLIVLHTYAHALGHPALCDAMILASPIVNIRSDFPEWKETLAHTLADLFPTARVSLETLSGQEDVRVTKDTVHNEQAATNPYHIERHTLHLLSTLGKMIRTAGKASQKLNVPILILHGGKDVFSDPADVEAFFNNLPEAAPHTRKYYPECFHLLFHDHQSELVVSDISTWLKQLKNEGK